MTKKRPSLTALAEAERNSIAKRNNVVALEPDPAPARGPGRSWLPHVCVYVDRAVQWEIKRLAMNQDRRPNDLYLEAIELLLANYERPSIAKLTGRERRR
jgi:hypothetical protein